MQTASDKKDSKRRKQEYGYMLLMKANSLRLMGNYNSADSAFVYTTTWVSDNLSKADLLYSWSQFLNARLLEENGLNEDALVKFYQKAYVNSLRKYSEAHYINILIQENIIKAYYRNDNKQRLQAAKELFNATIRKHFDRESVNKILKETIRFDLKIDDNRTRSLEDDVNVLLSRTEELPYNHQRRIDLLWFAVRVARLNDQPKNIETYLNRILEQQAVLYGEDAPVYHLTKTHLANFYVDFSEKFSEAEEIYESSYHSVVEKEFSNGHKDYVEILNHLARFYEETDQYGRAGKTLEEALEASRRKYDDRDLDYAVELEKIAALQIKIGQYDEADANLAQTLEILEEKKTPVATAYIANTLITQAKLLAIKGEYDLAEFNIFKSDKIKSKTDLPPIFTSNDATDDLAELNINLGRYGAAQSLLNRSIASTKKRYGSESRHITRAITLFAQLRLVNGEYSEAETLSREALDINRKIFGNQSSKIAPALTVLSDVFSTIGDYDKAEQTLNKVIDIQKSQFGDQHVDLGKLYGSLALVKFYNNHNYKTVQDLFLKSERIIGKKLGGSSPAYAETLKNLAIINIANKQYKYASDYLSTAGKIWSEKIGRRNNVNAATVSILKGDIEYEQRRYGQAEQYYLQAKKIYEKLFSIDHPEYVKSLSKLSRTYYMNLDRRKALEYINEVLDNYEVFIQNYFRTLSEREKAKFWNTIKEDYEFYYTLVISDQSQRNELIGDLYNKALLSKALLLNSSKKTREAILNSGDEELKKVYQDWIDKKELLTYALSLSSDQLTQNNINTNSLVGEIELLEKELSKKSTIFNKTNSSSAITWERIQEKLKEKEVALEMTRFRHFDHHFTDSVVYAVFYLKPEKRSKPELILIRNGKELESRYLKYYRNSIKFRVNDKYSYEQFWKPIEERVGNLPKIFLSPDGVYNQINLEAIPTEEGKYVLDNSNIVLVNNTKEIYSNRLEAPKTSDARVAMIFGDPNFYVSTEPGVPVKDSGLSRSSTNIITRLPGTRGEVQGLEALLNERGWKTDEYLSEDATEEVIKGVNSPRIMHIATHGFFESNTKLARSGASSYLYDNPLLKSGLLLTGAGDIFNQTKYNYNVDNGILTAYEAMNLNLDQTDLVVLSACETGLGQLESGEGVYGLQRSFLVAGAESVIMSLFKVSDEATKELMVSFYDKWMKTGDKRGSFIQAKKEIRNKYKDPIYWGPFVMIGMQ
ncbi:MAG: CHAT domain-containing protein [Bacteroidota bacterium]